MNNKQLGTQFEKELCDWLSSNGFWVHFITPDKRGAQPFDIIAVRSGVAWAFECKTLADNRRYFPFDRLEFNQQIAFDKWLKCGNSCCFVAVKWREQMYFIPYDILKAKGKVDMTKERSI